MASSMSVKALVCATAFGVIGLRPTVSAQDQGDDREIATKLAEVDYLRARLARVNAEIALAQYIKQTFKQDFEQAKAEIALADSDLNRAKDRLAWSQRMIEKGFLSLAQHTADKLALQRAKFVAEQAQTKLAVLEKYTKEKALKELRSEVEKAQADESAKRSAYERAKARREE